MDFIEPILFSHISWWPFRKSSPYWTTKYINNNGLGIWKWILSFLFEDSKLFVLVVLVFILVVGLGFVVVVVHQCTLFVTLLISNSILYSQSSNQSPPHSGTLETMFLIIPIRRTLFNFKGSKFLIFLKVIVFPVFQANIGCLLKRFIAFPALHCVNPSLVKSYDIVHPSLISAPNWRISSTGHCCIYRRFSF